MPGILDTFLYGRGIQWEYRANMSDERRDVERKIDNEKRYFMEKMSLDDCQRFKELEELYQRENTDICSYSFTMGVLLALEIMEKKQALITK